MDKVYHATVPLDLLARAVVKKEDGGRVEAPATLLHSTLYAAKALQVSLHHAVPACPGKGGKEHAEGGYEVPFLQAAHIPLVSLALNGAAVGAHNLRDCKCGQRAWGRRERPVPECR